MKLRKQCLFTVILLSVTIPLFAQKDIVKNETKLVKNREATELIKIKERLHGYVKLNLTGLAFKSYSVQLEKIFSKKISAAISLRGMPGSSLPFRNQLTKTAGQSVISTIEMINNTEVTNYAITPEIRVYPGKKGYGTGFYFAPFYRYSSSNISNIQIAYTGEAGTEKTFELSGKIRSNSVGMLLGTQWNVGSRICVDWWIAGLHYGFATGQFYGITDQPLSSLEQDELHRELNNLEIPLTEKKVSVSANTTTVKLEGPWGGIRAGLSIGLKL